MKRLLIVSFLIFFAFPLLLRADQKPTIIETTSQKDFPNIFRPIGNFFKRLAGKRRRSSTWCDALWGVKNVTLSRNELAVLCDTSSTDPLTIEVISESFEPEITNVRSFNYKVSGGKIIIDGQSNIETMGQKAKVVWDLSGVKPGIYTITVEVNNRCPSCVPSITKEIKVFECIKNAPFRDG